MTQDLVDESVFNDLADAMGEEFAAELVTTFLGDAANMFDDLRQAAERAEPDAYRRAAHSIKSNAQTFGAGLLADKARLMELSGTIDAAAVADLEDTFQVTAKALENLLDG